ncbi:hypothetical protein V8C26DRAFT_384308 [Trichoderma gracile]
MMVAGVHSAWPAYQACNQRSSASRVMFCSRETASIIFPSFRLWVCCLPAVARSAPAGLPLLSSPPLDSGPLHELRGRRRYAGGIHSRSYRSPLEGGGKKPMLLLQVHRLHGPVALHLQFGNGKPFDLATGLAASIGRCSSTRPEAQPAFQTNGSDDSRRPSELLSKKPIHDTRSRVAPVVEPPWLVLSCPAIA